jgi:hypothetical protein
MVTKKNKKLKKRENKNNKNNKNNRNSEYNKSTCKIYKDCDHVPCGSTMNKCYPSYCPDGSKNWSHCNMSNWGIFFEKYKYTCKDESKCKLMKNTKKEKNSVDALLMHSKMPYIWRFLKPNTRKNIIELANKKLNYINIPFMLYPSLKKHETIKKHTKSMPKHKRKLFYSLRKKYKNM